MRWDTSLIVFAASTAALLLVGVGLSDTRVLPTPSHSTALAPAK